MEEIDRAASNILRMKFEMGLFENPYVDPAEAAHREKRRASELAREVGRQGVVLLKNDNVLPLSKEVGSIA